ncbi:MAG: DUF418 domain-containing protein [Sphingobium sp.]
MTGQDRNISIDIVRGFAVMGIILMNIIAFSMPQAAYINPMAWGGDGLADQLVWMAGFVLVDGKLRGLFSLLFGASMLMLMERTEMAGGDGRRRHIIRCFWLALIGLAHYLLLWWGDILSLYAVVGLIALFFVGKQPLELVKLSFLAFLLQFLILIAVMVGLYQVTGAPHINGADPRAAAQAAQMLDQIGQPGSRLITDELALHRGGWEGIATEKANRLFGWWLAGLHYTGLEILGFMLMGMAMLKGGFLTGAWPKAQYSGTARHCFLIGLPPMIALALWAWGSGFAPVTTFGISFTWSLPFRLPLTVGIAALIFALIAGREDGAFLTRVGAVGRMALSNYLATSLVLTAIFYGWGLGLFGTLSRAQVYLVVPLVWAAMLLWSRPWLRRFRYGPAEWLWRSLTLFAPQPMRVERPASETR